MRLHLFSTPGKDDLRYIIEASRAYLEDKEARVAYLPLASLFAERWLDVTQEAFKDLASVDLINTEIMSLPEIQDIYRRASLLNIPGGNTFLLNHRLHISKLMPYLRKLVQSIPVVAFSAGTLLCGQNILTSKNLNSVGTPYFEGLKAVPYNNLNIPSVKAEFSPEIEKGAASVARALGYRERQMIKTLIFELDTGERILVMVGGDQNIVSGNLKKAAGLRNIKMASYEAIKETTGYVVGSIPPCQLGGPGKTSFFVHG